MPWTRPDDQLQVIIDIEDGTAVMRVRLCESIGKRLFGVDARDYRKMFQADPERAQAIQVRSFMTQRPCLLRRKLRIMSCVYPDEDHFHGNCYWCHVEVH